MVDLGLDLVLSVVFEELSKIDLKFFKKSDAFGESFTVKGGSNFDKSSDWVSGTKFGELHKGFSGGMWGDSLEFWDDDLKSVKNELGLFLSGEEIDGVFLSFSSSS